MQGELRKLVFLPLLSMEGSFNLPSFFFLASIAFGKTVVFIFPHEGFDPRISLWDAS